MNRGLCKLYILSLRGGREAEEGIRKRAGLGGGGGGGGGKEEGDEEEE